MTLTFDRSASALDGAYNGRTITISSLPPGKHGHLALSLSSYTHHHQLYAGRQVLAAAAPSPAPLPVPPSFCVARPRLHAHDLRSSISK